MSGQRVAAQALHHCMPSCGLHAFQFWLIRAKRRWRVECGWDCQQLLSVAFARALRHGDGVSVLRCTMFVLRWAFTP
eukprot:5656882-Alexandrium_andersonii.AAC.1